MARDLNTFMFEGRLVADPETRDVGESTVTSWRVAIDTSYKKKDSDEWVNKAAFVDVSAWNGIGKRIAEACKKGDLVRMSTQLDQQNWEDADGNKRQKIVFKLVNSFDWRKFDVVRKDKNTDDDKPEPAKKKGRPAKKAEPVRAANTDDDDEEIDF